MIRLFSQKTFSIYNRIFLLLILCPAVRRLRPAAEHQDNGSYRLLRLLKMLRLGAWQLELPQVRFLEPLRQCWTAARPGILWTDRPRHKTQGTGRRTLFTGQPQPTMDDSGENNSFPVVSRPAGRNHSRRHQILSVRHSNVHPRLWLGSY